MADFRTCICCSSKYEYCARCGKGNPNETWRYIFCSSDCQSIFNICQRYLEKKINKSGAKSELAQYKLKDISKYAVTVKRVLEEILAQEPKAPIRKKRK